MNIQFSKKTAVSRIAPLILIPGAPQKSIFLSAPLQECGMLLPLIFLLGKYKGEEVIVSLSAGHVLSPRPAACSWFSLSNDFG